MSQAAYAAARVAAPKVAEHLRLHRATMAPAPEQSPPELLPDARAIESMVDAAFWASVRREEGYIPKVSLAFLPPSPALHPLVFAQALPLEPTALTRLAAAVDRPGIHLGVWPAAAWSASRPPVSPQHADTDLLVWGTTHSIPPLCFVVEVIAPGLVVAKHRPREESRKFVNVAVLEGDRVKIIDERASLMPDCPELLTSMLGFDTRAEDGMLNVLVQIAVSMRRHARGGTLLIVPGGTTAWQESIVRPIAYAVNPPFTGLADLMADDRSKAPDHVWLESLNRTVEAIAGLTAVDGATVMTDRYELLAFGAKIRTRGPHVEEVVASEPIEGGAAERLHPGQLGGTRHLSAAQFASDQRNALAMVASQDGRFTMFVWSPCEEAVHAHRVEVLLL